MKGVGRGLLWIVESDMLQGGGAGPKSSGSVCKPMGILVLYRGSRARRWRGMWVWVGEHRSRMVREGCMRRDGRDQWIRIELLRSCCYDQGLG